MLVQRVIDCLHAYEQDMRMAVNLINSFASINVALDSEVLKLLLFIAWLLGVANKLFKTMIK